MPILVSFRLWTSARSLLVSGQAIRLTGQVIRMGLKGLCSPEAHLRVVVTIQEREGSFAWKEGIISQAQCTWLVLDELIKCLPNENQIRQRLPETMGKLTVHL